MTRAVPHRRASRLGAGDRQVPKAARLPVGSPHGRAIAAGEGHQHVAGRPLVPVRALLRVAPPVRPPHCHSLNKNTRTTRNMRTRLTRGSRRRDQAGDQRPLTALLRPAEPPGRNRRLTPVIRGRHRRCPKHSDGDDRGARKPEPGRRRTADRRGGDDDQHHAEKKEPGPPASPQGPRQLRPPAACGPTDRDGGQAQRSWHRRHRRAISAPAPRPPDH